MTLPESIARPLRQAGVLAVLSWPGLFFWYWSRHITRPSLPVGEANLAELARTQRLAVALLVFIAIEILGLLVCGSCVLAKLRERPERLERATFAALVAAVLLTMVATIFTRPTGPTSWEAYVRELPAVESLATTEPRIPHPAWYATASGVRMSDAWEESPHLERSCNWRTRRLGDRDSQPVVRTCLVTVHSDDRRPRQLLEIEEGLRMSHWTLRRDDDAGIWVIHDMSYDGFAIDDLGGVMPLRWRGQYDRISPSNDARLFALVGLGMALLFTVGFIAYRKKLRWLSLGVPAIVDGRGRVSWSALGDGLSEPARGAPNACARGEATCGPLEGSARQAVIILDASVRPPHYRLRPEILGRYVPDRRAALQRTAQACLSMALVSVVLLGSALTSHFVLSILARL